MIIRKLLLLLIGAVCAFGAQGADLRDSEGRLVLYVRGGFNSWGAEEAYRMTRSGDTYSITLPSLNGEFKIGSSEWGYNYGADFTASDASCVEVTRNGANLRADNLRDVTLRIVATDEFPQTNRLFISANGHEAPAQPQVDGLSGTLPVLYINVRDAAGNLDNEIIDRNLSHKNYFSGEYWLDLNGCQWLADLGAESVGSSESPLPLEIKARGNYTRTAFAKKPFKLKLGAKASLLGLSKSKHYAILAHADDNFGYLRNFTGFSLGRRIGLPWTPSQQPVEVVINGDYRGLYFLTESIRIEKNRIDIEELADNESDPALASGGYLVELDNYDEDNQIRLDEASCAPGQSLDRLRITWDTPEAYSDIQRRFVTDCFTAMNAAIGSNSDATWSYLDLDDAARYYVVEEIISHTESYHGSTYLFRDRGEGRKWHFSPLWDFGNAFNGATDRYFYDCDPFGNTWIPSMRCNARFNDKVRATWRWFMSARFDGLIAEIDEYVSHIAEAAKADRRRWAGAPRPDSGNSTDVVDNSDMQSRRNAAVSHLNAKIAWLKGQWGDYSGTPSAEPARDTTPAAPLPSYLAADIDEIVTDPTLPVKYYNLQSLPVAHPAPGNIYIRVHGPNTAKIIY